MSPLKTVSNALKALGKPLFYGRAGTLDGGDIWDYLVFFRRSLKATANKNGLADRYTVAIVQEEYVSDETVYGVIDAMTGIPGMRLADGEQLYNYTVKPNTDTVIEILTLDFVKPKKRGSDG